MDLEALSSMSLSGAVHMDSWVIGGTQRMVASQTGASRCGQSLRGAQDPKLSDAILFCHEVLPDSSPTGPLLCQSPRRQVPSAVQRGMTESKEKSPFTLDYQTVDREAHVKARLPVAISAFSGFQFENQPVGRGARRGALSESVTNSGDRSVSAGEGDIKWADPVDVWVNMKVKDVLSGRLRKHDYLDRHPALSPKMRVILLDWLIEVSEVYKLHRDTYHLAVDIFDRFMSVKEDVLKSQLQLIGVTALFIAAKVEEVAPPKINEFVYVCDGACTVDSILCEEIVMLSAIGWHVSHVTAMGWLQLYLQLHYCATTKLQIEKHRRFCPQIFVQMARLMDLCLMDQVSVTYQHSVLAAAVLSYYSSEEILVQSTGFASAEIADCVRWMAPFAAVVRSTSVRLPCIVGMSEEDGALIQNHAVTLDMLDAVEARVAESEKSVAAQGAGSNKENLPEDVGMEVAEPGKAEGHEGSEDDLYIVESESDSSMSDEESEYEEDFEFSESEDCILIE